MAILGPKTGRRLPMAMTGTAVIRNRRGKLTVAGWPRARPRRKTTDFNASVQTFDAAIAMLRCVSAKEMAIVTEATRGTQYRARDMHIMLMYGSIFRIRLPDGRMLWPMSAINNVSQALDALGADVGSVLVRYDDYWLQLPPGTPGQVLTSQGPGLPPVWLDPV